MSETRQHHCYSPSKLASLEACPKFSGLRTTSDAALTGTKQHNVAETGIDDESLSDEKAHGVATSLEFLHERRSLYLGHSLLTEVYLPIDDAEIVAPDGAKFSGTTAGYIDAAIISSDVKTAELIDMKYGQVAVEKPENNLQMQAYVLGLVRRFPTLEKVFVWIVAPHRDEVNGCCFTRDQFDGMRLRINAVVGRAIEANKNPEDFSTATPTQSGCLFCSLIGKCPRVSEIALKIGKRYAPLEIPQEISTSVFIDPVQAATALKLASVIKVWCDAFRAQLTAKTLEDPNFTPVGYRLTQVTKRSVVSAKRLAELAKEFLPEADRHLVEALYDIPIGAVEKLISTAAPRGSKERTVESFGEKALEVGAVKEGQPFAVLRQDNGKKDE